MTGIMATLVAVDQRFLGQINAMFLNKLFYCNEDKINSRDMIKNLIVGIVIMFVIAMGAPLLIEGLGAWVGISAPATGAVVVPGV